MSDTGISDDDVAEIRSQISQYANLAASGDWGSWLELFGEDASFLPPGGPAISGKKAIASFVASYPDLTTFNAEALDIAGNAGFAVSRGRYSLSFADPNGTSMSEDGKFIWVWIKGADNVWRIEQDIWNTDS